MNSTVTRTPKGKIKMTKYHQIPGGRIFMINEEVQYYGTLTTSTGCGCDGSLQTIQNYKVEGGMIPFDKAVIIS
jgi:hypothetical protein